LFPDPGAQASHLTGKVEEETLRFQALLRMDTSDPPGTGPAAEYLKTVLERKGSVRVRGPKSART
jgi:hypothetical protein